MHDDQGRVGEQRFRPGTPVYDAMGELIGTVDNHILAEQCLIVDKGPFRTENIYVPLAAVQRSEVDAVYLSLGKDDL